MQTKIGISAGIIAAAAYFLGLVGGWIPVLLIAGYVLIAESNQWLRMSVVKAVGICLLFAILKTIIGFVPDLMNFIGTLSSLFGDAFSVPVITKLISLINLIITVFEKILLLILGFTAFKMQTISFGPIDNLIAKHTISANQ